MAAKMMAGCVPKLALNSHLKSRCRVNGSMHLHAAGPAFSFAICGCMLQRHVSGQLLVHPMDAPPEHGLPFSMTSHAW